MKTNRFLKLPGATFAIAALAWAQSAPQRPQVVSPEVQPDRHIVFRIYAPQADTVKLGGGDIPGNGQGTPLTKGENGVWEATLGPLDSGAYRYNFNVGGVAVIDPRNPAISESNSNVWSLVYVPGSDFMDTRDVPHGSVASVTYSSSALGRFRRMHVYTPPGYEASSAKYPVFYLLHGAGDSDEAWTSVGRAGFILDNLIAAKKAKPMLIVMPAGHTRMDNSRMPGAADEFVRDFESDIMPYVEKHYRVLADRPNRAIAGLSMGGSQTLNIAIPHLEKFAYIGVFSSGLIGKLGTDWEQQNVAALDDANLKKGLKLVWFSTGKNDFLLKTTTGTVDLLKSHGFKPVYLESAGGHTWINWRDYLNEFAPQLFQ